MLFDPELFDPPLFEDAPIAAVAPAPFFLVARGDSGSSCSFTAPVKDPNSIERHDLDWSGWLLEGDAIATPDVYADLPGLTIDGVGHADGTVRWRIQGGTLGQDYIVTCQIITTNGLIDERSVRYRARQR